MLLINIILAQTTPYINNFPSTVNWTFIFTAIIAIFGLVYTILQIFGPNSSIKEENLRKSSYLNDIKLQLEEKIKNTENKLKETNEEACLYSDRTDKIKEDLIRTKESISSLKDELNRILIDLNNNKNSLENLIKRYEDLKDYQNKLTQRIDDILRQALEFDKK